MSGLRVYLHVCEITNDVRSSVVSGSYSDDIGSGGSDGVGIRGGRGDVREDDNWAICVSSFFCVSCGYDIVGNDGNDVNSCVILMMKGSEGCKRICNDDF